MDIYEGAMTVLTHIGTNQIETEKLILRRFKYTDNESMLSHWVSDHEIQSMYSEPVYRTNEEVRVLLNKYISSYDKDD
ncbi:MULTISPECIES: hypothetical protein [unclassified Clostridium]|uniref:hypothetical protein n=1 Tax=unclassified Clostridium TaxID=2614128 RepID=UPI000297CB64|nr:MULTISPECIES: hypothetical protein [unclassified Clostridium]EKQ53084.1 MAG: hypothetical protein A370_03936 [Clostridium sp. Maddingley MBC34-26]